MAAGKITLKNIKDEVDKVGSIKADTSKIQGIKDATDKIANIENKVGEMEAKIQALEGLVGTQDVDGSHDKDTGIYGAIYKGFNDLIGEP